jgi:hypothetical protein
MDIGGSETMKKSVFLVVLLVLVLAPLSFGGTLTGCVATGSVPDGSGGLLSTGNCNFYQDPGVYPYDLTPIINAAGPLYTAENYFAAGYVVFTSDINEVNTEVGSDQAAWLDVLYFPADQLPDSGGFDGSDEAILLWGASMPSVSTVNNYTVPNPNAVGQTFIYDPTGVATITGDINVTVYDFPSPPVPEPSTFLMMAGAGLAFLAVRRRRRA